MSRDTLHGIPQETQDNDGLRRRDVLRCGSSLVVARFAASLTPVLGSSFMTASAAFAQPSAPPPHIVYIVADDLGWKDVGFHGSDIKTPNIDKLAQEGARLEQFYVQPMCTPTRAALLTGRYPCRYGLQTLVIPTPSKYGLPTDEWLLPQALSEAGYRTVMVGKWHLGHADRKFWPRQRGFDYHYGAMVGEIDYFTHLSGNVRDCRNNRPVNEQGYVTQLLGKDAVERVAEHDPKTPLFLYLAFTAPHAPYQAPKDHLDSYQHIEDPTRRAYAAMITCMDDEIGKVIAALEKNKMRENTLIVFMSDNGGNVSAMFSGDVDVSKLKLPADNGPYRGGKGMLYEGGTRVAACANWPGRIKPGEVKDVMHVVDMFPTLTGLAGVKASKGKPLDGLDVWRTISEGAPSPRQEVVYNIEPFRGGVRVGDWKLIWRTPLPSKIELYNIPQDPWEKQNLADSSPQKVAELQKRIEQLAGESAKSLFLVDAFVAVKGGAHGPPALPTEDGFFTEGD
jgi:arylsulfatase A-like enzyme